MKKIQVALGSLLLIALFSIGSAFSPNTSTSSPAPKPRVDVCDFYKFITTFQIGVTSSTFLENGNNYVKNPSGFTESNCLGGQYFCGTKVCRPSTCPALTEQEVADAIKAKYDAVGSSSFTHGLTWTIGTAPCIYTFTVYRRPTTP